MRIVTVNYADRHGGAERVAMDLHRSFRDAGHLTTMLVGLKYGDDPDVVGMSSAPGRHPRVLAARIAWKLGYQGAVGYPGAQHLDRLIGTAWDFLILHGLPGNYFDFRQVRELATVAPTVLVLHDMLVLTGHCGHAMECDRFTSGCGKCPDLRRAPTVWIDRTARALKYKEETIGASPIVVSAPSQWMLDQASRSYLARFPMRQVPNPVDTTVFQPQDRDAAREALGLGSGASVFLLPAANLGGQTYKGLGMIRRAMAILDDPTAVLVTFGERPDDAKSPVAEQFVPPVEDQAMMSRYYAAADVVVYPSSAENSPLAVIEAMASGRAVVTTAVGGMPELFTDGIEGILVEAGNDAMLANALRALTTHPDRAAAMGRAGRARALRCHALPAVRNQWLAWAQELATARRTAITP